MVTGQPVRRFDGYALDLDGTVHVDEKPLPGAVEAIRELRRGGARVMFVTNKPLDTGAGYAAKLTSMGVPATEDDVVTALDALRLYLLDKHAGAKLAYIAEPLVPQTLEREGFATASNPSSTDVVVVSFDRTFSYEKLDFAFKAVRSGASIVATNPDPYCPTVNGGLPDCAAMLAALEACTGVKAEAVVGKPSSHMAAAVLQRIDITSKRCAMVGDRLATDVAMGLHAGMAGILVLTGATTLADVASSPIRPTAVVHSLTDLVA
ncbi:HAD-IIA family hydrolase [Kribbella ginsengisoli]|uniref:HAD-IIA family hydrolase n=1 Tax=Kribbella ginsengisoli TaxID=363865 RepID=A0ABP6Z476_9ACTN